LLDKVSITRSRVLNLGNYQITSPDLGQFIHGNRNVFSQDHGLDGDPAILLESINGRRTSAGCDLSGIVELGSFDVVCAKDILLRSFGVLEEDKGNGG
jgi:hypothetical protein